MTDIESPLVALDLYPQCSQIVVGTALIQLEGRSPTSSRLDGSMPLAFW